ncbi:MAG: GNAT family N-acetyltransferase [Phycisphaerae bacterium]|nr:GNAT family N-acetyltransferase [Phycisphaerae bacterium]
MYGLRPATDQDYDFLKRLHHAALRDVVERTWGWDEAFQDRFFAKHWDPADKQIISLDGRDVGMVSVEKHPDEWSLAGIMLLPDYQDRGIGTTVIKDILTAAAEAGLPVTLQVLRGNRAVRLYERLGFALLEQTERHFRMKAGSSRRSNPR